MVEKKILVVDDEVSIRETFRAKFMSKGYQPFVAASAEEALEILDDRSIQVMFLDLKLPGMNGVELCRTIRERNPIACVFAVTGYSSLFELADCREAGFDDYFTKPVRLERLVVAAEDAFEKLERWTRR